MHRLGPTPSLALEPRTWRPDINDIKGKYSVVQNSEQADYECRVHVLYDDSKKSIFVQRTWLTLRDDALPCSSVWPRVQQFSSGGCCTITHSLPAWD